MVYDPLQELRELRRNREQACAEQGQTYAEYISKVQQKYLERLVRRGPKPRLRVKEGSLGQETSGRV